MTTGSILVAHPSQQTMEAPEIHHVRGELSRPKCEEPRSRTSGAGRTGNITIPIALMEKQQDIDKRTMKHCDWVSDEGRHTRQGIRDSAWNFRASLRTCSTHRVVGFLVCNSLSRHIKNNHTYRPELATCLLRPILPSHHRHLLQPTLCRGGSEQGQQMLRLDTGNSGILVCIRCHPSGYFYVVCVPKKGAYRFRFGAARTSPAPSIKLRHRMDLQMATPHRQPDGRAAARKWDDASTLLITWYRMSLSPIRGGTR